MRQHVALLQAFLELLLSRQTKLGRIRQIACVFVFVRKGFSTIFNWDLIDVVVQKAENGKVILRIPHDCGH